VDIVLDLQERVVLRVRCSHGLIPDILACLYLLRTVVQVAGGIQVEVYRVIPQGSKDILAVSFTDGIGGSGFRIRTTLNNEIPFLPHVSREEAQYRVYGYFVPYHLIGKLCIGHLAGVFVRPGMAGNLVPFRIHSPDHSWVDGRWVVDHALAEIVPRDKESRFCSVALHLV
jgi:hypothetical protein